MWSVIPSFKWAEVKQNRFVERVSVEIRTSYLPTTRQKHYLDNELSRWYKSGSTHLLYTSTCLMRKMVIIWISLRVGFTVVILVSLAVLFAFERLCVQQSLLIRPWHRDNVTAVRSRAEWLRSVSCVLNPCFFPSQHSRSLTQTLEQGSITGHTDSGVLPCKYVPLTGG